MGLGVRERFENIQERVAAAALRSGRAPSEVCLVAAVKRVPLDRILEAVEAGVKTLGENYVQEAQRLKEQISSPVRWHMIGNLQSKKARQAVRLFDVVETRGSREDRQRIAAVCPRGGQEAGCDGPGGSRRRGHQVRGRPGSDPAA